MSEKQALLSQPHSLQVHLSPVVDQKLTPASGNGPRSYQKQKHRNWNRAASLSRVFKSDREGTGFILEQLVSSGPGAQFLTRDTWCSSGNTLAGTGKSSDGERSAFYNLNTTFWQTWARKFPQFEWSRPMRALRWPASSGTFLPSLFLVLSLLSFFLSIPLCTFF